MPREFPKGDNIPQGDNITGWLFAVYPDQRDGAVLWLITEDGQRLRLRYPFQTSFYVAARDSNRLQGVQRYLAAWRNPPEMRCTTKRDLFKGPRKVLEIRAPDPLTQEQIFYHLQQRFKALQFYNAKIPFSVRFGGETGGFPMAKCRVILQDEAGVSPAVDTTVTKTLIVKSLHMLDSPWEITYDLPHLRELIIEPDTDPTYAPPKMVTLRGGEATWQLETQNEPALLLGVSEILENLRSRCDHCGLRRQMVLSLLGAHCRKISVGIQPQPGSATPSPDQG